MALKSIVAIKAGFGGVLGRLAADEEGLDGDGTRSPAVAGGITLNRLVSKVVRIILDRRK